MNPIGLFIAALTAWELGRKSAGAKTAPASVPRPASPISTSKPKVTTPPWPAAIPADLPVWPGPGWVPDVPIGPGVSVRASQLLGELWEGGLGTHRTERVKGRWITFVARRHGQKKAVEAYRVAADTKPITVVTDVITRPASNDHALGLPTLKKGMKGPDVVTLQKSFGWGKTTDFFGQQTHDEVVKRQQAAGLPANGIVDARTWALLLGRGVSA